MSLTIWCNAKFNADVIRRLQEGVGRHRVVFATEPADPALAKAEIAFGQPSDAECLRATRLRWVEVTTAGYTRYDTPEFREAFRARGSVLTTASGVFADPCAQHVLAMMLALARNLPLSQHEQATSHSWRERQNPHECRLLTGQTVVLLGFGAIGHRLVELLAPFGMKVSAVRRSVRSEAGVHVVPEEKLSAVLSQADHVVNILPANDSTQNYVNARRLACFKRGARFYNVGRGVTVDQRALVEALHSGRVGAAYLDVTDPEPLPPEHPLWTTPGCHITPHVAGGRHDHGDALIRHFLSNLAAFEQDKQMTDRVI